VCAATPPAFDQVGAVQWATAQDTHNRARARGSLYSGGDGRGGDGSGVLGGWRRPEMRRWVEVQLSGR
jgi:hypothetical protein